MIVLYIITGIILIITSIQDILDKDKVSSWMFAVIPVAMIACALLTKSKIDWIDCLIGATLGSIFFVFTYFGGCGGADAIMALCIGFAYGSRDTAIFIVASCLLFLIYLLVYSIVKKKKVKEIKSVSLPFIPAAAGGFLAMIILNHIIYS